MIMIISALPLVETQILVVNNLIEAKEVFRRKVGKDEFDFIILEVYNTYKIDEIQLIGPFTYIDALAHHIQILLPYDDYELIVNIDDRMNNILSVNKKDATKDFLTYGEYVDEIKTDLEKQNQSPKTLMGLDGKPIEVHDYRELQ